MKMIVIVETIILFSIHWMMYLIVANSVSCNITISISSDVVLSSNVVFKGVKTLP